jgi:large conductance mechanosensitive channel
MGFFSDFKASLMKGDVLSLATAVVIGGAFGKIVGSAVDDVIMPIVGLLTGGIDFTQKFITLDGNSYTDLAAAKAAEAAVITYGNLVQAIINFVIISFFIFVVLRAAEKARKKQEVVVVPAAPAGPTQEELLIQIRDLLKEKR